MTENVKVSIVVPAYNEELAIGPILQEISAVMEPWRGSYELIVVDDGSTDNTAIACRGCDDVVVVSHAQNRGTGAARTTGTRRARGEYVVMIDADGTYPVSAIPTVIKALQEHDMVIGARSREMGTMPWPRSLAKNAIKALASYMTETRIPDLNSGLRGMRRELIPQFFPILPTSHSWVSTITMAFLSAGYSVKWIPIDYHKRIGKSTFHPITDTYNYIMLVIRAIMYFNPLRVFLPVGLAMLGLGLAKAVYDIFAYRFHFAPSTVMVVLSSVQVLAIGLLADLIVRRSKT